MARVPNRSRTVAAQLEVAVPEGLVEFLKSKYPVKVPDLHDSEREIFFEAGRQDMIRYLESLRTRQERAALKNRQNPDADGRV